MRRPIDRLNRGRVPAKGGIFVPPPPVIFAITNPADLATVTAGVPITIDGTSPDIVPVNVTANAVAVGTSPVTGNLWSVPWTPSGSGLVTLAATDGTLSASISVTVVSGVAFAFTNPANLATIPAGVAITVSGTSPNSAPVTVTANAVTIGTPAVVGNVWSFSWTPSVAGPTTLAATDGTLNTNISITVSSAAPTSPFDIVTSVPRIAGFRADQVVLNGSTVSQWTDQTGNARHATQATPGAQPTYNATGGPNSTPIVTADGVDDWLAVAWIPPAPGTTPFFFWYVARIDTFTANRRLCGGQAATRAAIVLGAASPNTNANNGTASGVLAMAAGAGNWNRCFASFANSVTTDEYRVGPNSTGVGVAFGNNTSTGFGLFALNAAGVGSGFGPASMAEFWIWQGKPSSTELANLDAYVTARYGAGVAL